MVAFAAAEPATPEEFEKKWNFIRANEDSVVRTIVMEDVVVGNILSYLEDDIPQIGYWIDKVYWGRGIASAALQQFLAIQTLRPLGARAASDNIGSIRVLERCGFRKVGEASGFANARGCETEEFLFELP